MLAEHLAEKTVLEIGCVEVRVTCNRRKLGCRYAVVVGKAVGLQHFVLRA